MSAKIHARDGHWSEARKSLDSHKHATTDKGVQDLRLSVDEGEKSEHQAKKEMQAQLWTACYESATRTLRVGAYAVGVREMRSECALRAGDIESAVGDLSRLTHLRGSTTPSEHLTIFLLAYFFLPAPISASQNAALTALKQCLHLDPDSSLCLPAHRQLKALDRGFGKVEGMVGKSDWRGVLDFLLGKDRTGTGSSAFLKIYEDALREHTSSPTPSPSRTTTSTTTRSSPKPLPTSLPPTLSPRLTTLLRYLCQSHTQLNLHKRGLAYCERLLSQDRSLLSDGPGDEMDVGDAGKAEYLLGMEEWEQAVRVLEGAWERGRGEDVSFSFIHFSFWCGATC
jgi:DnaJ homolog subfamily C member 3